MHPRMKDLFTSAAVGCSVFSMGLLCLAPTAQASPPTGQTKSGVLLPTYSQISTKSSYGSSSFRQARADRQMIERRFADEKELEKLAVVDRKVWIRMRDGKKMAADIYYPKGAVKDGGVPTIMIRTPYDFNFWDVKLGAPANLSRVLYWIKHDYAVAMLQERGHYYSQGKYEILGTPRTDGYDEIKWLTSQPWSNGKLAPIGCSSTAEWQLGVVNLKPPGLATFNVEGFGAGIGRVGPYYEQGNWYQGGAYRQLFTGWIYGEQNTLQPLVPPDSTQQQRIEMGKMFTLIPDMPNIDWAKAYWHLPVSDQIQFVGGPKGIFASPEPGTPTGGEMIQRYPNSPAWYKGGLWNDSESIDKPGLWFMSWYDVSVSPNFAAYNWVRGHAPAKVSDEQYAIIGPGLHCQYGPDEDSSEHDLRIGGSDGRDAGDARYPYRKYIIGWFDHFLKGKDNGVLQHHPKVTYYLLGKNEWKDSPSWPPPGAVTKKLYLSSNGGANSMFGDGVLQSSAPAQDAPDKFTYNPATPVPTLGGGGCCLSGVQLGSFDQRPIEARNDVLVYSTPVLEKGMEVSGPITLTLYVSSSAKDTDFTFKVMDVYPDGKAYNLTQNIQRVRWREGYDHAPVFMQPGHVYKVTFQPIDISNYFKPGHRLQITVSSSNFPYYDRNLNTGANNQTTTRMVVAHNVVHHSGQYPSQIDLSVLPTSKERPTDPVSVKNAKQDAQAKPAQSK